MSIEAPFSGYADVVRPEWIDRSGRLGIGHYGYLFEEAARAFFRSLDLSQAYRERSNHAYFALEEHMICERECFVGDRLSFTSQIVAWTPKRMVCVHSMFNVTRGGCAAVNETIYAHVDLSGRRSVPLSGAVEARLRPIIEAHERLPRPPESGRAIHPIASG